MNDSHSFRARKGDASDGNERRGHDRAKLSATTSLVIRLSDGSDHVEKARAVDVSGFGMGVETRVELPVDAAITILSLSLGGDSKDLKNKKAHVVYSRKTASGNFRSGLAFDVTETKESPKKPGRALDSKFVDHYETLQLNVNADTETIQRVYRLLAGRYHPDNVESGNEESFRAVLGAYRVLSDPEKRAAYDATHAAQHEARWQIFSAEQDGEQDAGLEKRIRMGILAALFRVRSANNDSPTMSNRELEHLLVCPREHLEFGIWYLRGKRYIERADNGRVSITPEGVDAVEESAEITPQGTLKLLGGAVSDESA